MFLPREIIDNQEFSNDRTTQEVLLERIEALESSQEQFKAYVNEVLVNLLNQKQQPGRSPDALLHKRLTDIAQENAPDAPKLVIAAIAEHFKDLANGVIYQHLSNIYRSLN